MIIDILNKLCYEDGYLRMFSLDNVHWCQLRTVTYMYLSKKIKRRSGGVIWFLSLGRMEMDPRHPIMSLSFT